MKSKSGSHSYLGLVFYVLELVHDFMYWVRILVLYIGSLSGFYGWVRIQILCSESWSWFYVWVRVWIFIYGSGCEFYILKTWLYSEFYKYLLDLNMIIQMYACLYIYFLFHWYNLKLKVTVYQTCSEIVFCMVIWLFTDTVTNCSTGSFICDLVICYSLTRVY